MSSERYSLLLGVKNLSAVFILKHSIIYMSALIFYMFLGVKSLENNKNIKNLMTKVLIYSYELP